MSWWISGGVVVLALIGLVAVVAVVLASLRRFAVAAQSLQRRLLDGQQLLQPALETLQARGEELQGPLMVTQQRAEALAARRGADA